jgi:hypothetical protein
MFINILIPFLRKEKTKEKKLANRPTNLGFLFSDGG